MGNDAGGLVYSGVQTAFWITIKLNNCLDPVRFETRKNASRHCFVALKHLMNSLALCNSHYSHKPCSIVGESELKSRRYQVLFLTLMFVKLGGVSPHTPTFPSSICYIFLVFAQIKRFEKLEDVLIVTVFKLRMWNFNFNMLQLFDNDNKRSIILGDV